MFSLVLIITVPSCLEISFLFHVILVRTVVMLIYDLLVPCLLFLYRRRHVTEAD